MDLPLLNTSYIFCSVFLFTGCSQTGDQLVTRLAFFLAKMSVLYLQTFEMARPSAPDAVVCVYLSSSTWSLTPHGSLSVQPESLSAARGATMLLSSSGRIGSSLFKVCLKIVLTCYHSSCSYM